VQGPEVRKASQEGVSLQNKNNEESEDDDEENEDEKGKRAGES
jgi:hypothetical protein